MRDVIPSANNGENEAALPAEGQNDSSFQYEVTLRRNSAFGWSSNLWHLPEMSFIQLDDYLVVSTCKYQHIVLNKGTHYQKTQIVPVFLEGNLKKLESKRFEDKRYVKVNVLPSMKRTPYKVVVKFSPTCEVLRATCTCPAGLGLQGKGKCNHIGGVLFAIEDFYPEPLTCSSRLSVWVVPRNQSVAAKPLDKVLIRKIRFGKKNIRTQPKMINFDPRSPQERNRDDESFKNLCGTLQNCLPASSFFLFHDIKSNCASSLSDSIEETEHREGVPFTDNFDIATT